VNRTGEVGTQLNLGGLAIRIGSRRRRPKGRDLADEEQVSHYGKREPALPCCQGKCHFRHLLRRTEKDLSIVVGFVPVDQLGPKIGQPSSGARYSTVGKLREAGFTVLHTPTRENPDHGSVYAKGDWTPQCGQAFNACFGTPVWVEDTQEQT
jgi:hypothetical protein